MAATLTLPVGNGPFPAAILLSVAGPNDRDQTVGPHRGYSTLADHLARNGIASIRMGDRSAGASTGNYFGTSWEGFAEDAAGAYDILCERQDIACDRIGYVGMSQGGAIGALASRLRPESAFLVLLSAPGLDGVSALREQLEATIRLQGIDDESGDGFRALFEEYIGIVTSEAPDRRARLETFLEGPGRMLIPPYRFVPREPDALTDMLLGDWYQSNVTFDPSTAYGLVDIPVLAIGGTNDPVAPPASHLAAIATILEAGAATDISIETIEGGNHLLQIAPTGAPSEYRTLEHAIAPQVLERISDWIGKRTDRQ